MTSEAVLKSLLKKMPETVQTLLIVSYVANRHGLPLVDEGYVYSISDLGREMAELMLKEDKWQDVAEHARKDLVEKEILH